MKSHARPYEPVLSMGAMKIKNIVAAISGRKGAAFLRRGVRVLALLFFFLFHSAASRAENGFDHSLWDAFLKKYVNEAGGLDYRAAAKDPGFLNDYWEKLKAVDERALEKWSREEKLAFWLNAYHAALTKLVLEHYPLKTVQDIPGFWNLEALWLHDGTAKGAGYSLNDIWTRKLEPAYDGGDMDLILSVAARGGPRLMPEAFTGAQVGEQMFRAVRWFINDPARVDIDPGRKIVRFSRIFESCAEDAKFGFKAAKPLKEFSPEETAILLFIAYYLEDEAKADFLRRGGYRVERGPFDWRLNDWKDRSDPPYRSMSKGNDAGKPFSEKKDCGCFDGSEYFSMLPSPAWNFMGDFVLSFRVKIATGNNMSLIKVVSHQDWNQAWTGDWNLSYGPDGKIYLYIKSVGVTSPTELKDPASWNRITVKRTGLTITVYVNGVPGGTLATPIQLGSIRELEIGRGNLNLDPNGLRGCLDEIMIENAGLKVLDMYYGCSENEPYFFDDVAGLSFKIVKEK